MPGLNDYGEEAVMRDFFLQNLSTKPTDVYVGLYHSSDSLTESDDLAAITTEPGGANYSRDPVAFGTTDMSGAQSGGDYRITFTDAGGDISFDVSDSSVDVDSYFVVMNFASEVAGDGGVATDHLIGYGGDLGEEINTANWNTLTVTTTGVILS